MNDTLFSTARRAGPVPLADAARPRTIDEIIGQEHLLGIGKTTIARAIGNAMSKRFETLHAANLSVSEIKKITDSAQFNDTVVFIDEIHRLNATQQDNLLEHSERGTFDLITATSQNPYHNLSAALNSRSSVYELRALNEEQMLRVLDRGVAELAKTGTAVSFDADAKVMLARKSGGDARRALTTLEGIVVGRGEGAILVTAAMVEEELDAAPVNYDRKGEMHFDCMSAFAKSMRGGDPDATLYWLGVLLHGGEDPRYIARRLVIHASEDVGLADNSALQTAVAAFTAVERVGMPEGRIILAHAALHVCLSPKSNSAYRGINLANAHIRANAIMPVPSYLRDTDFEGAGPQGRGGYKSPHSAAEGWVEQEYAPGIPPGSFYQSDARQGATFEARSDSYWEAIKRRLSPRKWKAG